MNERFITQLLGLFQSHGLVNDVKHIDIDRALEQPFMGFIVQQILPERLLVYDVESMGMDADIVRLVQDHSKITQGEWLPANLKSNLIREEGLAIVDFDFNQQHFHWEFHQQGDTVDPELLDAIKAFSSKNLAGRYLELQSMSQESYTLYLPAKTAHDFEQLVRSFAPTSDEIAEFVRTVDDWDNKGLTGWALVLWVLRQHDLSNLNKPTKEGYVPLDVAVGIALNGSSSAKELAYELVGLGADPSLLDDEKRTYWRSGMK